MNENTLEDIYFKDAFTKTGDKLNLEIDNINVSCLTSKNNKFSLDSEGNLVVNSISYNNNYNLDLIYPIGSIYMSVNSTDPSILFGGSWAIWGEGRVPVGVSEEGTFNSVEKVGGSETQTLTTANLPSHTHAFGTLATSSAGGHVHKSQGYFYCSLGSSDRGVIARNKITADPQDTNSLITAGAHTHTISGSTASIGSGTAHNNLQPYITCYMWKRVA